MKRADFLKKIRRQGKIDFVEPSEEIAESYRIKSENCLKSARLLHKAGLFENSVGEAYYAMYDMLLSLLFRCGIKSENHTASIMILGDVFGLKEEEKIIHEAKKERIDKQYYVTDEAAPDVTKDVAEEMIKWAERFIVSISSFIAHLTMESSTGYKKKLRDITQ